MDSSNVGTTAKICFLTVVNTKQEEHQARFLIESLRSFGGELRACPVWVFVPGTVDPGDFDAMENVAVFPLDIEAPYRHYILADKVFACARAEELAGAESHSLVWLNLDCLIANPPVLFDLGPAFDAALRPVHIKNVGSPAQEPLDDYWKTVYRMIDVEGASYTVESFVDAQILRPYFNTHCFSINPARGILQVWREYFKSLVIDKKFQAGPCQDELHQVFLHQVVLSAVIMKSLDRARIRMLPPEYSYPLHLQQRLPASRRVKILNSLVCAVYEEDESRLSDFEVQEPLKSWLAAHQ
jgi:hypothetical protein